MDNSRIIRENWETERSKTGSEQGQNKERKA